jgi:predicted O-methyltransferase YrrM
MRIRSIKRFLKSRIKKLFISEADQDLLIRYKQNSCFPPGHYYSPIVDVESIKAKEKEIWPEIPYVPAEIDLNANQQLELLHKLEKYYNDFPYRIDAKDGLRYTLVNSFFDPLDAITLYSFIRHFGPKNIIEVGSGFSSAVMLDTNASFNNKSIRLTFIEPFPERLNKLFRSGDQEVSTIIEKDLQDVSLEIFASLKENDILFIDSTHVCKTGSDLNYLFFQILPALNKGVIIHFHDVFNSFEYPRQWVLGGRNWNENYLLRAFLMYNHAFKILLFNEYLFNNYHKELINAFPFQDLTTGGSIYLIKN